MFETGTFYCHALKKVDPFSNFFFMYEDIKKKLNKQKEQAGAFLK